MAIEIFANTKLEILADQLIDSVAEEQQKNGLFHKTEIIVPNKGIAKFLSQRFAERKGIVACIEFPYLMSWIIRNVFHLHGIKADHGDDTAETADFLADIRPATIAWRIYHHLPELLKLDEFAILRRFLKDNDPKRLWDLAAVLGKQFDILMLQRPDWLVAWENDAIPPDIAEHRSADVKKEAQMQGILWKTIAGDDWKGNHFAAKLMALQRGENITLPRFKNPVRLFGFSAIPESIFTLLEKYLNTHAQIEIYSFEPCDNLFWGDAKSRKEELTELEWNWFNQDEELSDDAFSSLSELYFQNNMLIGSFARNAREFFIRTADYRLGDAELEPKLVSTNAQNDILRTAQNLIRNNSNAINYDTSLPETDWKETIQIHSCYSPFREVEAAHDFLLQKFAENPDMQLKDVFILTPDPELYAPMVDAVFNNPTIPEAHRLHVAIADMQQGELQSSLITFFRLLDFWKTDFTANDVFAILRQSEIMEKAGFTEDTLLNCGKRVNDSGIRWGWDAEERFERYQYPYQENTWIAGFDRMLTAYAMDEPDSILSINGTTENIYASLSPNSHEDLGRLIEFTEKLHDLAKIMRIRSNTGCSFDDWTAFLLDTAKTFFPEKSPLLPALYSALNNLRFDLQTLSSPPELVTDILTGVLKEKIALQQANRNFMTGSITFCSLHPMRSIPAKVICLLGMDHDKFPKSTTKYGFDLTRSVPRQGDRSSNLDDRQLFLDLFLSARNHLFISYTGQGIRDNKKRPPSPCVDELYQWLCSVFGKRECFCLCHPLQAFSPRYFTPGSPLRSHSQTLCQSAKNLAMQEVNAKIPPAYQPPLTRPLPEDLCRITLSDLLAFFRNPAQSFFKKRLKVFRYDNNSLMLSDEEVVDFRVNWALKSELFDEIEKNGIQTEEQLIKLYAPKLRADAKLPLPPYGQQLFLDSKLPTQLLDFNARLNSMGLHEKVSCPATEKKIMIADGTTITLQLPDVTLYRKSDGTLVQMLPILNASYPTDYLPLRIQHAAVCAMQKEITPVHSIQYFLDPQNGISVQCTACFDGMDYLRILVQLYADGMKQILPFFPKTSYACWKASRSSQDAPDEAILKAMRSEWQNAYAKQGEVENYKMFFGEEMPSPDTVLPIAKLLFDPIICQKEVYNKRKKMIQWEIV